MQITINVQLPINDNQDYELVHDLTQSGEPLYDFLIEIQEDALGAVISNHTDMQEAMWEAQECIVYVRITHDGEHYDWTPCEIQDMFRNCTDYLSSKEAFEKMVLRYNR